MEPIHAMFWSAPEVFAQAESLGYDVKTRWPSYFAWRPPPGAVGARERAVDRTSRAVSLGIAHGPAPAART